MTACAPVKSRMTHVTRHTSHTSHVPRHTSHVTRDTSHVTRHTSPAHVQGVSGMACIRSSSARAVLVAAAAPGIPVQALCKTLRERLEHECHATPHTSPCHTSHVTRHTSHATRHTSHVTRDTSHVTRHTSHVTRHTSPAAANSFMMRSNES
jgi:hypothetical protein